MPTFLLLTLCIQVSIVGGWYIWVPYGGPHGAWSSTKLCPEWFIATGFRMKVERHAFLDISGVNAIYLLCTRPLSEDVVVISSGHGRFGDVGNIFMCDPGTYIQAFSLRVGGRLLDYMGVTNIRVQCSNGKMLEGDGADYGDWGKWSGYCTYGVIGLVTKDQKPQGWFKDDSAVNDLRLVCNKILLY